MKTRPLGFLQNRSAKIFSVAIDIKIGLFDNPREFLINTDESVEKLKSRISAVKDDSTEFLEFKDTKGKVFLFAAHRIAYVEFGVEEARKVGFSAS